MLLDTMPGTEESIKKSSSKVIRILGCQYKIQERIQTDLSLMNVHINSAS